MTTQPVTAVGAPDTLVDWADLNNIELVVLKRMKEYAVGAHPSVFQGSASTSSDSATGSRVTGRLMSTGPNQRSPTSARS